MPFLKSKSENRDLKWFKCVSRGFHDSLNDCLSSRQKTRTLSCNASLCPQKTLLHFSIPRYGGRSQECPDNIITNSDVSCWKGRLSFFRFFNVFFFKCFFFFSKNQNFEKGRKSVSSNVSRYRPITAPRYQQRPGVVQALHWLKRLFVWVNGAIAKTK